MREPPAHMVDWVYYGYENRGNAEAKGKDAEEASS